MILQIKKFIKTLTLLAVLFYFRCPLLSSAYNKPFQHFECACALVRVTQYPESCN